MKIISKNIFLPVLLLLNMVAFAGPPAPTPPPPTPPGFPLDENLVVLLVAGLVLGSYVIYKKTVHKKTSV